VWLSYIDARWGSVCLRQLNTKAQECRPDAIEFVKAFSIARVFTGHSGRTEKASAPRLRAICSHSFTTRSHQALALWLMIGRSS
jgi:hypothetical protein